MGSLPLLEEYLYFSDDEASLSNSVALQPSCSSDCRICFKEEWSILTFLKQREQERIEWEKLQQSERLERWRNHPKSEPVPRIDSANMTLRRELVWEDRIHKLRSFPPLPDNVQCLRKSTRPQRVVSGRVR